MKNPAFAIACSLLMLTACAVGPDYQRPAVATPAAFKEDGLWRPARPQDAEPRGNWWEIYGDASLNTLVTQVAISNQNVASAAAQYRQAMALLQQTRAGYYPTLGVSGAGNRSQSTTSYNANSNNLTSGRAINNSVKFSLDASWEPDLWGRIERGVEASEASAQASQYDLDAALLSAQATLVQTYFQLRAADAQTTLLAQTVAAYRRSLEITRNRYQDGVAGRIDVAQAESQLKTAEAQHADLGIQRAQYEHAIAVLIGKPPADFALPSSDVLPEPPVVAPGIASTLLERRPDIAGAERRIAAANAQIGVAQSAYFPALTLNGNGGYQNSSLANLFTLPHRFWSLGPALALTLFDGGARSAQKAVNIAAYDKTVADYRQTVLAAFQDVEDNLAALRQLQIEADAQQAATAAANEALRLTENQYLAGTVSYLNVIVAQTTALTAQRSALDIANRRLLASAGLIKALGGRW